MSATVEDTAAIRGVRIVTVPRFGDERGSFCETYSEHGFAQAGLATRFVQDNQAFSAGRGTVRGLHFQVAPDAQAKLVRVLRGAILDVAVDLRRSSPTYGHHVAVQLSARDGRQLFVPAGFAHGYCTTEPDTEVFYKVDAFYAPASERGLAWDDPALGIVWPVGPGEAILSERDRNQPRLADLPTVFD